MALNVVRTIGRGWRALMALGLVLGVAGCQTGGPGAGGGGAKVDTSYLDRLRKGDLVEVKYSGSSNAPEDKSERIKEDGSITLPLVGAVPCEGKTAGDLQQEIHELYVPHFYRQLTVTVNTELRYFYVYGEVRHQDRIPYSGQITVLQAIAAAGGFTDFAARTRIELNRLNGEHYIVNGKRAAKRQELDLPVFPGDTINVPRRSAFGGSG